MCMQEIDLKILSEVVESSEAKRYVRESEIAEKLGLDFERVRDHFAMLEEDGLVEVTRTSSGHSAFPTSKGRLMITEPEYMFKRLTGPMMIQVLIEAVEKSESIPQANRKSITDRLSELKNDPYISGLGSGAILEIVKKLAGF